MSNSEQSNVESNKFDKGAYQREYMANKRAAEKLAKALAEDRVGEVSLASVEKESVVQTNLGDSDVVTPDPMEEPIRASRDFNPTETDKLFEIKSPGYWIYGNEVKERKCWQCGKPYGTRLELNKFCGPKCKEKWLSDAFGKLKGVKS